VEDSNFCKALLIHDFRNAVARDSLRREFLPGRWLGFNPHFREFGGEEWYIHEK